MMKLSVLKTIFKVIIAVATALLAALGAGDEVMGDE